MYMTRDEWLKLSERAFAESGLPKEKLYEAFTRAGWSREYLATQIETPGWLERLEADGATQDAERVRLRAQAIDGTVLGVFQNGPIAMAQLAPELRLDKLSGNLRAFAETYAGEVGVALLGPTGVGKTLAAVHAADRIVRKTASESIEETWFTNHHAQNTILMRAKVRAPVRWFRATEIGKARRNAPLGQGEPEIITDAMKAPIAIIDDVGWELATDSALAEIVAERYDRKRPTVITSGLRSEEIEARYGAAFLRRVVDGDPKGKIISLFEKSKPLSVVAGAR